jgi:hypothetical protein
MEERMVHSGIPLERTVGFRDFGRAEYVLWTREVRMLGDMMGEEGRFVIDLVSGL